MGDNMNEIDISKYIKKDNKKDNILNKPIIIKTLISIILFFIVAIICKKSPIYKNEIYNNLYEQNWTFTKVRELYNKYLGSIIPIDDIINTPVIPVFNEQLSYLSSSKYMDGVELEVQTNYLVPIIESGIVVYVGEKEKYGNTIIIQGMDGIDIWYGGINTSEVKLYDYIEKGNLLGEVKDNKLYLVWTKEGNFLNYEEYLP